MDGDTVTLELLDTAAQVNSPSQNIFHIFIFSWPTFIVSLWMEEKYPLTFKWSNT